jgi:hypothetical protein
MSEPTREELEQQAAALGIPDPAALPNKEALEDAIDKATPNPALVPDPPPAEGDVRYRVIGPRLVHDTPPGETFTATLAPGQESSLVEAGHIIRDESED